MCKIIIKHSIWLKNVIRGMSTRIHISNKLIRILKEHFLWIPFIMRKSNYRCAEFLGLMFGEIPLLVIYKELIFHFSELENIYAKKIRFGFCVWWLKATSLLTSMLRCTVLQHTQLFYKKYSHSVILCLNS